MELNRDARIACPWCQETSTVGETDDESFAQCRNREMRREYTHMMNSKSMRADTQVYFKCPKCGKTIIETATGYSCEGRKDKRYQNHC